MIKNKDYLRRTEASEYLNVNKDTLINWEKKGYITPIRTGNRGDRRYSKKMLDEIANTAYKDDLIIRLSNIMNDYNLLIIKLIKEGQKYGEAIKDVRAKAHHKFINEYTKKNNL